MATNKQQPTGTPPFQEDSRTYVDPNEFEDVIQPTNNTSAMDIFNSAKEAAAEADAASMKAAMPQTAESQRQANVAAVKARANEQRAAQESGLVTQPVDSGMASNNQDQLPGQVWSGTAMYANGVAPRIVRLGNGDMMAEVNGVFSFVRDEKDAAFIVGLDREQAEVQLKRQDYRVQEAKLEASLDAMTTSTRTFNTFNRALLSGMAGSNLAQYPPDVQERLRGLYEDDELMESLYSMEPSSFLETINQLHNMMLNGSSRDQLGGVVSRAQRHASGAMNSHTAQIDQGFEVQQSQYANEIKSSEKRLQELEDQRRKYLQQVMTDEGFTYEQARAKANLIYNTPITDASDALVQAKNDWRRINRRREGLRSKLGSQFDPQLYGGSSSIEDIYNSDAYGSSVSRYGGTIWSMMDLVARDSGFEDGLASDGFKTQLSDPEQAAMFIRECQRKAELNGWSSESVEPWVNGLAQHVLGSSTATEISNIVGAAMRMQQDAKFDIAQQQTAGGSQIAPPTIDEVVGSTAPQLVTGSDEERSAAGLDLLGKVFAGAGPMSPDMQRTYQRVSSAGRAEEGTAEEGEERLFLAELTKNMTNESRGAVIQAYMNLPTGDSEPGFMDKVGEAFSSVGEGLFRPFSGGSDEEDRGETD
tara:strand:+ start:2119 stop:4053 length:1935 start_codon:yes stop_codon:yes gene_type:complete